MINVEPICYLDEVLQGMKVVNTAKQIPQIIRVGCFCNRIQLTVITI